MMIDVGFTLQGLEVRLTLFVRVHTIVAGVLEVTPGHNVFQTLVVLPILVVLGGDHASAPTCIDEIFKFNHTGTAVFA